MLRALKRHYPTLFALGLVMAVLFLKSGDPSLQWVWIYRWLLLAALMFAFFGARVMTKVSVLPALCVMYFAMQALGYAMIPMHPQLSNRFQTALHVSAFHSALVFVIVPIFMMARGSRWRLAFFSVSCFFALSVAALILSVACFFQYGEQVRGVPFFGNASMTGTFIAIVASGFPGLWPLIVIPSLAALKVTTPFAVLFAGLLVRSLHPKTDGTTRLPMWGKLSLLAGLLSSVVYYGWDKFSSGHGRYHVWRLAIGWHQEQNGWIRTLGAGPGSVPLIVPQLQEAAGLPHTSQSFFSWLHNDWLQILFEQGTLGLLLALTLFGVACWRTKRNPRALAMVVAYGVAMTTNYPLRLPLTAFLGIMLLGVAYLENEA